MARETRSDSIVAEPEHRGREGLVRRYSLAVRVLGSADRDGVRPAFERVFREAGLPEAIQSDRRCQATSESDPLATRKLTPSGHASFWLFSFDPDFERSPDLRFSRSR
jgi:hypothetical protein